ncbi:hypothetical protein [Ruania alba]|uniref:Uncharacterized protein n=1 Tax=Ruania alba TaxID=648782 RepID=A0A1H5L6C9_9MICO|nr:hypothetical protein [Ruania alba]SEE72635.1 hypothetical protein SAMN04488554_2642 [Ruania alba]
MGTDEDAKLPEERRTRLRALLMWMVAGATVLATLAGIYAVAIGFPVVTSTTVTSVATVNDDHGLLVRYEVGSSSCHDPYGIEVTETDDAVRLDGRRVDPTGTRVFGKACTDDLYSVVETVWLDDPLEDRRIVLPDGTELEPVDVRVVLDLPEDDG